MGRYDFMRDAEVEAALVALEDAARVYGSGDIARERALERAAILFNDAVRKARFVLEGADDCLVTEEERALVVGWQLEGVCVAVEDTADVRRRRLEILTEVKRSREDRALNGDLWLRVACTWYVYGKSDGRRKAKVPLAA